MIGLSGCGRKVDGNAGEIGNALRTTWHHFENASTSTHHVNFLVNVNSIWNAMLWDCKAKLGQEQCLGYHKINPSIAMIMVAWWLLLSFLYSCIPMYIYIYIFIFYFFFFPWCPSCVYHHQRLHLFFFFFFFHTNPLITHIHTHIYSFRRSWFHFPPSSLVPAWRVTLLAPHQRTQLIPSMSASLWSQ